MLSINRVLVHIFAEQKLTLILFISRWWHGLQGYAHAQEEASQKSRGGEYNHTVSQSVPKTEADTGDNFWLGHYSLFIPGRTRITS